VYVLRGIKKKSLEMPPKKGFLISAKNRISRGGRLQHQKKEGRRVPKDLLHTLGGGRSCRWGFRKVPQRNALKKIERKGGGLPSKGILKY